MEGTHFKQKNLVYYASAVHSKYNSMDMTIKTLKTLKCPVNIKNAAIFFKNYILTCFNTHFLRGTEESNIIPLSLSVI